MADYKQLVPFILKWEGGFVDDPLDKGGATNKGVTIATFRQFYGADATVEQLKNITDKQWNHIFKSGYWNKWLADEIRSQSVANILVDWLWLSGSPAIKNPQRLLGVVPDGVVGPKTIAAVNAAEPKKLFGDIKAARVQYINDIIVKTPTNERFRRGWMNRLDAIRFES
ncbi:MAG: peptidoglycan domain protein [Bacteroidales bacterium]|jgi:lysozyme family protein|nr:peptidoglycan domain protein [Bacteroidales bacterium]